MSQIITNRVRTSRRALLKGFTAAGARIVVGLPPLASMFNSSGTAYAATPAAAPTTAPLAEKPIETRFVLWFNGNGIPERYWIPTEEGSAYELTPCLSPLAAWRKDVHVLSGVDNAAASGKGNGHTNSMSGLMTGMDFTGRGPSGRDYRRATSVDFEKTFEPAFVELAITDSTAKYQPDFHAAVAN